MLDLSPEEFLDLAARAAHVAAEHLRTLDGRPIAPGLTGADAERVFGGDAPEAGAGAAAFDALAAVVAGSRAQNGRFLGYVLGSGDPAGAPADLLASVLNQNATAYRS